MRSRSSRILWFFLARPWWINVLLGAAFYLLLRTACDALGNRYGQVGQIAAEIFAIVPGAALAVFLMFAAGSAIERRRRK
jgi:hypothetical protein